MNPLIKLALGLCGAVFTAVSARAEDTGNIDMTCNTEQPVIMLVAGRTLDAERMRDYAIALGSSDLYPNAKGYYLNSPRPIRVLEGAPHDDDVALMVRFQHMPARSSISLKPAPVQMQTSILPLPIALPSPPNRASV